MDPQGPNITGGFGEALTTALDVMTFTHDLDINASAQGLNLASNAKPKSQVPNTVALNNQINTALTESNNMSNGVSMFGTLTQLTDSKGFDQKPKIIQPQLVKQVEDPFRELVLLSDNVGNVSMDYLKKLASAAANLPTETETIPTQKIETKNVKNLAGIFAGTEMFVKKVEESVRKKYASLEPSDSEGIGDGPLLGKVSRTRRAKSAHQRNKSAKSDQRHLIQDSDSSSTDTVVETNENKDNENLDYADERLRSIKESLREENSVQIRPVNIEMALEAEQM